MSERVRLTKRQAEVLDVLADGAAMPVGGGAVMQSNRHVTTQSVSRRVLTNLYRKYLIDHDWNITPAGRRWLAEHERAKGAT